MGGNRTMSQMGPYSHTNQIGQTSQSGRLNGIQTASAGKHRTGSNQNSPARSQKSGVGNDTFGNNKTVAPPDVVVGPNVSHRTLQK